MSKRSRSYEEQKMHDRKVLAEAEEYFGKEYNVWASVEGFPGIGNSYHGYKPDVVAVNNGHKTLVEIETPSSKDTDRAKNQKQRFKAWASQQSNRHFEYIIVDNPDLKSRTGDADE